MNNSLKIGNMVDNLFTNQLKCSFDASIKLTTPGLKLNSHGFRSDEFKTDHNGKHILFSGCSVTFGSGLEEKEIWAKKIYEKIKTEIDVSGFFNLAMPGVGVCDIVANVFKYISNFGKPSIIFLCLPPVQRRYVSKSKNQKDFLEIYHCQYKNNEVDEYYDIIQIHIFHYLMFLEMFCKEQNIKLYYFSYSLNYTEMFLNRFFKINEKNQTNYVAKFCINNPQNKYAEYARDSIHHGEGYHNFWFNHLYSLYKEELK